MPRQRKREQIAELRSDRRRVFDKPRNAESARLTVLSTNVDVEGHRQLLEKVIERRRAADIGRTKQECSFDLVLRLWSGPHPQPTDTAA